MSFVFPAILGGVVLVGIPVLIHLIMRQKPKTLQFPAFRFLIQKHRTNLRKLRIRHWLLLALRMLLIVLLCLALSRPRLDSGNWALPSDRPVAAVLVFDTSPSMEYKPAGEESRLDEARKRALELLDQFPARSRIAILDSADTFSGARTLWANSLGQAQERIEALKIQPANLPITARLETGLRLLADLSLDRTDEAASRLPRLLFAFSDRTQGSVDASKLPVLADAGDQVAAAWEGLQSARETIPPLLETLKTLRTNLPPPAGVDYSDQELTAGLQQLLDRLRSFSRSDIPLSAEPAQQVAQNARKARSLLQTLARVPEGPKEFREKLVGQLHAVLRDLRGFRGFFMDVGVDQPLDLALLDIALPTDATGLPRQLFGAEEKIVLRPLVRAVGKEFNATLVFQSGKKTLEKGFAIQSGERVSVPLELDPKFWNLEPGQHSFEVAFKTADALPFNNQRFASFAVRVPRKVLIIADDPKLPADFAFQSTGFVSEIKTPLEVGQLASLNGYQAVYLFGVADPSPALWSLLEVYVQGGGGLGIFPPNDGANLAAYNNGPAQRLLPGAFTTTLADKKGVEWKLEHNIFQHGLLKPLEKWLDRNLYNVFHPPRLAFKYWDVQPSKEGAVLVRYHDKASSPALLERQIGSGARVGKVLLFTSPFDQRQPAWNNYLESLSSFFIVVQGLTHKYLAGDAQARKMNFISGQEVPVVVLPSAPRFPGYLVRGPNLFEQLTLGENQNDFVLRQAKAPGNYSVEGAGKEGSNSKLLFSVNVPAEESDLTRLPANEFEGVLGPDSLFPVEKKANIRSVLQGQWSEPVELFSLCLVLLLLMLAFENLLANKFYRRENVEDAA